ncbi:MAG: choice-of-anchor D domain-containing protein, partial [Candidatus Kapaibacteriota bacterium]
NWNSQQIYIVAFIQDDQTKEVLQAAQNLKVAKVKVQAEDNPFLKIARKGQVEYTFNVTNPSNELMRVNVAVNTEASFVPVGWSATPNPTQLILQPNQTQQVKVTLKSGNKAEFAIIGIDFIPNVQFPYEVSTGYFYALTEDTKYAFYALANSPSPYFAYQGILNQTKYANDAALLPFALDVLNNYPAVNFDLAMFGFNFWVRGVLAGIYVESSPLFSTLNSMISAGKSILLTSEVDLALSQTTQGSPTARDFYANKLAINKAQEPVMRVTANSQGQITAVNPYPATGVTGDPIGNGISLTMNQYNQNSHPHFIVYTDILSISDPNKTKPIIYYDNNSSAIGGVRVETGDSRIVYLTSGFEAIADPTRRNGFAGKIFDWLLSKQNVKLGPQITISQTAIDFEEVIIGTTATKSFDITNSGDEDLIISDLYVDRDFDPDEVFNIKNLPSLPLTIKPNQSYTVEVTFSPKEEAASYTSTIIIKSNAKNAPDELVTLDGIGVAGNVPLITASKTEINFGSVQLQNTKISDVDITNSGLAD